MRAFVLYCVAFVVICIYNERICPYVSTLPAWHVAFVVFVPLVIAYLMRIMLLVPLIAKEKLIVQARFVGWMDFLLFFLSGLSMILFNKVVHDFPLLDSGAKVFVGSVTVGFFVALDLALEHNRKVMQAARNSNLSYELPQVYYPLTTKFFFFGVITVLLFSALVIAVITRDLYLLSLTEMSTEHVDLTYQSILIDIAYIILVLLGFSINLLYSYSLNLNLLFANQTGILERVSMGDMEKFVPVMSTDEFGIIAGHTNTMISGLRDRIRMMEGLKVAAEMQQALFPKRGVESEGLDIAANSIFSDETGGDFFDFLENLGENKDELLIVLGDVTGHGIGAALLMASTRAYLRMQAEYQYSPAGMLSNANRLLAYDCYGSGRFVTLFCLHITGQGKHLKWASAGHDPALIFNADVPGFRELKAHGLPLGVLPDSDYEEVCCDALQVGEVLLIGTDGIWEAMNKDGEMFGKERLQQVIKENHFRPAAEILHAVGAAVKAFQGDEPQLDDITIVVVKGVA